MNQVNIKKGEPGANAVMVPPVGGPPDGIL